MPPRSRPPKPGPAPDSVCGHIYQELNEWSHLGPHEIWEVLHDTDDRGDAIIINSDGPTVTIRCEVLHDEDEDEDEDW